MNDRVEAYRLLIADVYELAGLSRRTSESVAAQFEQTVARWHLMSVLDGAPHTVAAAARRLGLARQSVQRVADDLVAAGLATLTANPDHARSPLFHLTTTGHEVLSRIVAESDIQRGEALARAGISSQDLTRARRVLHSLLRALQQTPEAASVQCRDGDATFAAGDADAKFDISGVHRTGRHRGAVQRSCPPREG